MRLLLVLFLLPLQIIAQDHVRWASTSRKLSNGDFEVHLVASIDTPYHIYSSNVKIYSVRTRVEPVKEQAPLKLIGGLRDTAYFRLTRYDSMWREPMTIYMGSADFVQIVHFSQWVPKIVTFVVYYTDCTDKEVGLVKREKLAVHFQ